MGLSMFHPPHIVQSAFGNCMVLVPRGAPSRMLSLVAVVDTPGSIELVASIASQLAETISHLDLLRMNPMAGPCVIT